MNIMTVSDLCESIRAMHGAPCEFLRSVCVKQVYKGRVLWQGIVGIFRVDLCSEAVECYAWATDSLAGANYPVVFLKTRLVDSPAAAVREHIMELSESLQAA
jgi:hypothetical protein